MRLVVRLKFYLVFLLILYGCKPGVGLHENKTVAYEVNKSILKNGLTVVTRHIPQTSLVSIELMVKTGSATENNYLGTGISHFLEHLIFKGSGEYKAGDIARHIKSLGGEINAFTNYDYTAFVITVPEENLEKAVEILVSAVYTPSFNEEEFKKERNVILNEIHLNEDQPERKIQRLFWSNFYRKHPYRHPVIGYPELFSKLTLEDLVSYHKRNCLPNNMILSLAGNFDKRILTRIIEERFSVLERGEEIEPLDIIEPFPISVRYSEESFPTKLMYLMLGFLGIEINSADLFALDILATILGEGESSRLNDRLKEKESLVYEISCFNHTPKDKGIFGISLVADYKNKDKIVQRILEDIEKVKRRPVSHRELTKAKNILLSWFHFERERVEAQAHELAVSEFLTGDPDFYNRYIDRIKEVTPQDLLEVARKYLRTEGLAITILKPRDEPEIIKEKSKDVPDETEIEKIKLPNGMTLLLKEDHRLPIVSIRMSFLGGLRLENKGNNGISNLCADLLVKGTRHKTAEQISSLVEGRGGSLGTFSGNNSMGIFLSLLSKDTVWGMRILAELVKFANFPDKELEKLKIQTTAKIKNISDDPFGYTFKLLKRNLFLRHPYGMDTLGEIDIIQRLSLKDIYKFYEETITPANCVLSIWGDFEQENIIPEIESLFSAWKPLERFSAPQIPVESPIDSPRMYREKTEKKQAIVAIGFHTVSMHNPQHYTFEVLNAIMSGQGNRLFEKIREQLGLAYAVGTYSLVGIEPGYFVFYAATGKDNLDKVKEVLFKEIQNLRRGDFSDEEIERAKAYLAGKEKRHLQTNSAFSLMSSLDELYGLGFDNYKKFEDKINAVSKEDLELIAQKYFNLNNYTLVEIIPP